LARAEKEGLMASSFSKLNSEIRNEKQRIRGDDSSDDDGRLSKVGHKRTHTEKEHPEMDKEEAERKERDEIRRLLRKENERNRRRE
jgi:hypothetical protein